MPSTYARRHRQYYKTVKWLNARQSDPTKNRALAFFNKVKRFKRYLPRNTFFGAALTSAVNQFTTSVPDLNTRGFVTDIVPERTMSSDMFNRGAWYGAMYKGMNAPKPGLNGNERPGDAEYVAQYRNQRSTFGRKKRYTLRKIKRELRQHDTQIFSRFQTFKENGFQDGIGGQICSFVEFQNPAAKEGFFPFQIFDVTSLYGGLMHDKLSRRADRPTMPIRAYQLGFNVSNQDAREYHRYGWLPLNKTVNSAAHNIRPAALIPQSTFDEVNVAVPTDTTRMEGSVNFPLAADLHVPRCEGFTHCWSDIQMVLYPQTSLPTKWHVALISFPDDLVPNISDSPPATAGPPLTHFEKSTINNEMITFPNLGPDEAYSVKRSAAQQNEDYDNLDYRWQAFWSGKLQNPINRDTSASRGPNATDSRLPFKIIKHESFMQPARDNPQFGGQAQRLIKKLFYRRDWTFPPSENASGPQIEQGDALMNLNTIQTANGSYDIHSSPYPKPSEIVYLAVWCEHYKVSVNGTAAGWDYLQSVPHPGVNTAPSFDLNVRMKHILRPENFSYGQGFHPDEPVAPEARVPVSTKVEPEPAVEPQPPDEPVKKRRSKKNGILDAAVDTSGIVPGIDQLA